MVKKVPTKQEETKAHKVSKNSKVIQKAAKFEKKWAKSQLKIGDYFSCHQYMKVLQISGSTIKLENQDGRIVEIDKEVLLCDSYSADHFEKEVTCNMTELSEILKGAKDTIFKVEFKKKVDEKSILEKLTHVSKATLKKEEAIKTLAKEIIEGEQVTLIGHLVESEQHMGRSLIIDLEAPVDHRFK